MRILITQQRGLDARPVKQDATPAKPHARDFAGRAPVEQSAAADRQFRQQLFFVNEAPLTRRRLFRFDIHGRIFPDCRSRSARFPNKMNSAFSYPE